MESAIQQAAEAIRTADALLIGAGAGMGVDSGLPDFRGDAGFWKAYPPFRGRQFAEMSNPHWFQADPQLAWGFFGHRMNLYRSAVPHDGFAILRRWGERLPHGYFVFTSNVDGHFQKAGFAADRIIECHGSMEFLQCNEPCGSGVWSSKDTHVDVDAETIRAVSELPRCPGCGALARPNVLMFGDWNWEQTRFARQRHPYADWLDRVEGSRVVAIEMGAGAAIPTVREHCEARGQVLIRINPRDAEVSEGNISLSLGALEALTRIAALTD
jgi:NAD-dependent SIR2 family protein deacetylase